MAQKRVPPHTEDIKAAIRKTGLTCEALGKRHGFHRSAVGVALVKPWPAVEAVIAEHLGRRPQDLWPNRYDMSGLPLRGRVAGEGEATRRGDATHRQKQAAA